MLCDDLSRKEDPTLLLVFILHMSDEWKAIHFCLLFSETRSGVFPADRRKPNEFFAELIKAFRRLLLVCLPCVQTHACFYAGIYVRPISVCIHMYVLGGMCIPAVGSSVESSCLLPDCWSCAVHTC